MSAQSVDTSDSYGSQDGRSEEPPKQQPGIRGPMFPLSYKDGFSQWWCSIPAAAAEHKVLSFMPILQHPPTHTQTGNVAAPVNGASDSLTATDPTQADHVSVNSDSDSYGPRRWQSSMVELSGKNRALNEFSVERVGETTEQNLVILHGYGAGLGFFYKNFEALSRAKGWQLYALDMLGMGRSTRPAFKMRSKQRQEAITEAEDWFIDALEEWRVKRKIERFTLLGHSLGGYMAVAYALKYPGRLNKLILASPVGIPEDPYAVTAEMPDPSESTTGNESMQEQSDLVADSADVGTNVNRAQAGGTTNGKQPSGNNSTNGPPRRPLSKWITYLWDANISPFSLIRWSGPLGPRLVSGWSSRRFAHLPPPEAQALHDYSYSVFRLRGSGEYALAYILAPGAFARSPLIRRIQGVGRQMIGASPSLFSTSTSLISRPTESSPPSTTHSSSTSLAIVPTPEPSSTQLQQQPQSSTSSSFTTPPSYRENGIPVVLMYGDRDWMDATAGYAAKAKIEEEKARILKNASEEEKAADKGSAKVVIVKDAGHHLYLDGWEEFNEVILKEMRDVSETSKREGS
ncbi:hypothetical protein FQN54_004035 [Arachnomyces sp. PD_36]|nr:hypothetical protein FQN54_004035 [Arachnomyces sp. PD_36]